MSHTLAKLGHQLLGIDGTDSLDHAAAQVFFDPSLRGGRGAACLLCHGGGNGKRDKASSVQSESG
jgi:hypothetical protein